jgi:periplasmic protein TonB
MSRDGVRGHLLGSVPISIAAHFVVVILLLVIPLAANVYLPPVERGLPEFVRAVPVPPPPAFVLRSRRAAPALILSPAVAPLVAPASLGPEALVAPGPQFDVPIGSPGGLPAGMGEVGGFTPPVPAPNVDVPRANVPVRVALLPQPPRKVVDARPIYPDIARNAHVEGTVILEAVVDTSGAVTELRVVRSIPLLDQAALEAVRRWRYTPSMYGGRPVSVLLTITMRFTLNQ